MIKEPKEKEKVNDWLYHPNGRDFLIEGSRDKFKPLFDMLKDQITYRFICYYPVNDSAMAFIQTKSRIRLDLKSFGLNSYPPMDLFSEGIVEHLRTEEFEIFGKQDKQIEEEGKFEPRLFCLPSWEALEDMSKAELARFTPYIPKVVEYFWDKARDTNSAIGSDVESIDEYVPSFSRNEIKKETKEGTLFHQRVIFEPTPEEVKHPPKCEVCKSKTGSKCGGIKYLHVNGTPLTKEELDKLRAK